MKGKLWELGPFVLAILVGAYFLVERLRQTPAPLVEKSVEAMPRKGMSPRLSTGAGDPTKPEDFLPDPNSQPDPNSLPDPRFSTMTRTSSSRR